jgi:hypothetical protein
MFQYKETNGKGSETTPKFYNDMPFYSPMGVILVELKDGGIEQITTQLTAEEIEGDEVLHLVEQFIRLCEDQSWLIQKQEEKTRDLQSRSQLQ